MSLNPTTAKEILKLQIEKVQEQLRQAEQNLDYAEPEFIEVAIGDCE